MTTEIQKRRSMNLVEIAATERELVSDASNKYGKYFDHAQFAVDFLHTFVKSGSYEAVFFSMFLATVEKHIVLGALSGIRLHHVQANFNFRYATEAGAWAAYAMAHPDPSLFAEEEGETLDPTKQLKMKMYNWLEEKYPAGSASLKRFKDSVNKLSTHANIVDAHRNFDQMSRDKITTSFFDQHEEHHVKTDLWTAANLAMGLLDLFYGVHKDYPVFVLQDDFLARMGKLKQNNNLLKEEMMKHPRLARWTKPAA